MRGYLGDFADNSVVSFAFTTHDKDDSSPLAPSSAFEAADIAIYRMSGGGTFTKKATSNGITMTSPVDSVTGLHGVDIDTSVDTGETGFVWGAGGEYVVVLDPDETVDSIDPMSIIATFSIERTGGVLANSLLMMHKNSSKTYSQTSDSLEAIRDRGDAAWLTGASGASDHAYVHAVASTGIVIGDVDAGTIANIDVADGTVWSIGEVAGTITYPETAGGQGLRVELTFAGAVGDMPVSASVWAVYSGSAGHSISVYAYDYVGSGWEYIGSIPNGSSIQLYSYALTSSNIKNDGEMQLMFHHSDGTGVATHYLSLDKVQVNVRHAVTSLSVADIEGSNVLLRSATSGKNQIDADTIALEASLITATDVTSELLNDWKFKMFLQLWYSPQGNSDINIVSGAFSGGNLRFTFYTDDIYAIDEGGTDFIVDLQPDGTYTLVSGVDTANVTYVGLLQNGGTVTISSDLVLEFVDKRGNKFYARIDAGASVSATSYIRADGTRTSYWASNRSVYGKGANDNPTVLTSVKTVTDALSGTDTELSAIPTTTSSVIDKIKFLFQYFRNRRTITATTETIFKEDASTPLGTSTVSDDGTTFTKGEAG